MKCPNCDGEMEKGMLSKDSRHWIEEEGFRGGIIGGLNIISSPVFGKINVWAWRCAKCKKIELTSD